MHVGSMPFIPSASGSLSSSASSPYTNSQTKHTVPGLFPQQQQDSPARWQTDSPTIQNQTSEGFGEPDHHHDSPNPFGFSPEEDVDLRGGDVDLRNSAPASSGQSIHQMHPPYPPSSQASQSYSDGGREYPPPPGSTGLQQQQPTNIGYPSGSSSWEHHGDERKRKLPGEEGIRYENHGGRPIKQRKGGDAISQVS